MICTLCRQPVQLRDDHTYRAHENDQGLRCIATGIHPDTALAYRRKFKGLYANSYAHVVSGADGIGIHTHTSSEIVQANIWVTLTPAEARRMAAELVEIADAQDGRG